MTREEAKDLLLNISAYDIDMQRGMAKQEAIDMAIKALEQEPCEDAISRQAVKDLGAECIAKRDENGNLIPLGSIDSLPSISTENPNRSEIKQKCDRINSLASVLPYAPHREIQELLCEIMDMFSVSTEKTGRWIPVSERLPKAGEYIGDVRKYYLIQDEYGDMHVAHLNKVGWIPIHSLKAIGDEVIAWMPLPPSYEPQESEGEE